MTTPKAEEDVEQKGLLFFAVTMQNDAATVGDGMETPLKPRGNTTIGPSNATPRQTP